MERCPDEVLQLILNELPKPAALVVVSRRLRAFAADPYVRASYLIARHGRARALYHALGRGDIMTGRVLDILMTATGPVSRHLVQLAVQHYHHGQVPFIHRPWVRALPFAVFVHFLELANAQLGGGFEPAKEKGLLNDAEVFMVWVDERAKKAGSEREVALRAWVVQLLGEWKLQPVCDNDSLLLTFEFVLAYEPELLAIAVRNGYRIHPDHCDFIFRRLFFCFKSQASNQAEKDALLSTLRELCELQDSLLFLSRTVAAEVVMGYEEDADAYSALQALEQDGLLTFSLEDVTVDLIKSFATTRSVATTKAAALIYNLYQTLPAAIAVDPAIRHVVLVATFSSALTAAAARAHLVALGIAPRSAQPHPVPDVSVAELADVLASPFVSSHICVVGYAQFYARFDQATIDAMLEGVAVRCLRVSCKGEMLAGLVRKYPRLRGVVSRALVNDFALDLDGPSIDGAGKPRPLATRMVCYAEVEKAKTQTQHSELGPISQTTLATSFSMDSFPRAVVYHISPTRWNRPRYRRLSAPDTYSASQSAEPAGTPLRVADWIVDTFGPRSAEAAVYAEHALAHWLVAQACSGPHAGDALRSGWKRLKERGVPVTMRHWRIVARAGKDVEEDAGLYGGVKAGEPFYECAADYIGKEPSSKKQEASRSHTKAKSEKAGATEAEREVNRAKWAAALGALYKQELRAHNEWKKRAGLGRVIRPKFLIDLDFQLWAWRRDAREKKAREIQLRAEAEARERVRRAEEEAREQKRRVEEAEAAARVGAFLGYIAVGNASLCDKRRRGVVGSDCGDEDSDEDAEADSDSDYEAPPSKRHRMD